MKTPDTSETPVNFDPGGTIPAGNFSAWLRDMRAALETGRGIDVPCGDCDACCRSSLFIHVGKDEKDALTHIPKELLFKAPGLPEGIRLMGYDARGKCPMLTDKGCAIYEHRPATCRTFDCRVFAAAGIQIDGENRSRIAERAARWDFSYPANIDREERAAVKDAAKFLFDHARLFPERIIPPNGAQLAVLAVRVSGHFMRKETNTPVDDLVQAIVRTVRAGK